MRVLEPIHRGKDSAVSWLPLIMIVFLVKYILYFLDPFPMFFLGDSYSYITTSLTGWIPPDRSFVYGFVIKLIAVSAKSLSPLIAVQIFTSGLNAVLVSYVLIHFFSLPPRLASLLGLLCALEPLQLLYERYVMTEAFSLFFFAVYIVFSFHYLKRPRLIFLIFIQILGTGLISLRLSLLPIVLINAILLPLLILSSLRETYPTKLESMKDFFSRSSPWRLIMGKVVLHIIISLVLTYSLHYGYRSLNGYLSLNPPAYQYQDGIFLLAFLGPIVKPIDFPETNLRDTVFNHLKYNLKDRLQRAGNHWQPGGLIAQLNFAVPNSLEANSLARQTAFNALKRDPIGVARLAFSGFLDYWNRDLLRACMSNDRGDRPLPEDLLQVLRKRFNLSGDDLPYLRTFTNQYFFKAWAWYLFLLCLPITCFLNFFVQKQGKLRFHLIIFIASFLVVSISSLLIEGPTVRYLHPLGWLSFLVIGTFLHQIQNRLNPKGGNT